MKTQKKAEPPKGRGPACANKWGVLLTGRGEQLLGLEFTSESGSLVIGNNNRPFNITLSNTANQLTYGILGAENAVTIDGSVPISAGWNPLGSPDVEYSYGLSGGAAVGPFKLFQEPPAELDVVRVSLNDNFNWVLIYWKMYKLPYWILR